MIRKKRKADMRVPTSSMGDIAFLLIIFFLLASNFMKSANVESIDPESPDVEVQESPQISVIYDSEGRLWLQGLEISVEELTAGVQQAIGTNHDTPVHVRIDKYQKGEKFLPIIQALSDAGARMLLAGGKSDEYAIPAQNNINEKPELREE